MSAPIRPNDSQSQAQAKKVFRRKKIGPLEQPVPFQFQFGQQQHQQPLPLPAPQQRQKFFVERRDERPSTCRPKIKVSKIPAGPARARSAISSCDIVTLVSLLSPGGSDSEKEEHSLKGDVPCTERGGPSLRKIGKSGLYDKAYLPESTVKIAFTYISVSFQDDDDIVESNESNAIDLSSANIRRASLVPLASKIRMNRPPTAPPGSIFAKNVMR